MNNPSLLAAPLKIIALASFAASLSLTLPTASADPPPGIPDANGTFHVPAFLLPESSLFNDSTRAAVKNGIQEKSIATLFNDCPTSESADHAYQRKFDRCVDKFYQSALYKRLREQYPVTLTHRTMGGVYTEVLTPARGIAAKNENRVLVNLHGGGFVTGARTASLAESIPIAFVGKIKVVSVDYRMAPDYRFPAASEDVEAVYRELLKTYRPQNIGIYGCSAGGLLTAEVVAWLHWKGLPRPGAVGMFCATGLYFGEGDSGHVAAARFGIPPTAYTTPRANPYFSDVDINDPLAFPMRSDKTMEAFPPSLFITSTRDQGLSSVAYAHSRLVALGVDTELHVWEGLEHGFFYAADLRESREAYDVTVKFFDQYLGRPPKRSPIESQEPGGLIHP